ncbi:cytochrome c biogenesis protein DipZ [Amycolatopsis sp. WQ 127309]|uniref:cytochrome c biogenesis protein DipZ n=1 Tax=Amycolatopsis sp. WQ 127309 TaxID=2932773 RepID=UPI001FF198A5|nr:cytochrome c biogenesis protein DipZ [Amycolatopsis sp. WQ 127309]UOZ06067.1 cytochrome c biogenesis protein DipZ [Amycolatopsis sp. WQ 127309]
MWTLILIGLLGGLITGVSPCILPVLPVVFFAGGAKKTADGEPPPEPDVAGDGGVAVATRKQQRARNRRPYAVIGGLVLSFTVFTLLGSLLIKALNLPDDILRIVGLVVLSVVGLSLLVPPLERLLEKPFSKLPQRKVNPNGGGFGLGLGLGLLYVPCAGPVLTAITIAAANGKIGVETVALTVSFAIGATAPLLVFALAGAKISERVKFFRKNNGKVRAIGGVVMLLLAVALYFDLPSLLQTKLPDYTGALQEKVEGSDAIGKLRLSNLGDASNQALDKCANNDQGRLRDCGPTPEFENIDAWINSSPQTMAGLKGKVVLVDFWTYSCINCQRSIPHIKDLYSRYQADGLEVVGVHTPEFAFEHDKGNVEAATKKFGITYPVAIDNETSTFNNFRNQYWPARYLIDATGQVRYFKLGEGDYDQTENLVRQLLQQAKPGVALPAPGDLPDTRPTDQRTTRETYLSRGELPKTYAPGGTPLALEKETSYAFPSVVPDGKVAFAGNWTVDYEKSTAGAGAEVRLGYTARSTNLVLAGEGTVTIANGDGPSRTIKVSGTPNLYRLTQTPDLHTGQLTLTLSPGLQAYSFTFD